MPEPSSESQPKTPDDEQPRALNSASGWLFTTGFIFSKLQAIPIMIVSGILSIVSLLAYLIGYIVWYIAALCYPEHKRKQDQWYGFADFKHQYQVAALIGTTATVLCILFPLLIIPTAWLYTVSNSLWAISEHHKQQNPPKDDVQYSNERQTEYLRYATLVACTSALTAVATTIAFFIPPIALTLLAVAGGFGICITVASLYYWGRSALGTFPTGLGAPKTSTDDLANTGREWLSSSYSATALSLTGATDFLGSPQKKRAPMPQHELEALPGPDDPPDETLVTYSLTR